MTEFHKQSFQTRFGTMGDPAEAAFDAAFPKNHKLGLNRPNFTMSRMTLEMRYTPDRMTADGFVEVMGIGRDQTLKIKQEKIAALQTWEKYIGPVDLFVYDQANETWYKADLDGWIAAIEAFGVQDVFPEGKTFYRLHRRDFPADPVKCEVENVAA